MKNTTQRNTRRTGGRDTGIAADYAANVTHTYLYNAPRVGGLLGSLNPLSALLDLFGVTSQPDPATISNLKADAGISPIAGLGSQVSPVIPIAIEDQAAPITLYAANDKTTYEWKEAA